jgi:hypothetical protein
MDGNQRLEMMTVCHSGVIREEPTMLTFRRFNLGTHIASWTHHPCHGLWAASVVLLVSIVSTALIDSTSAVTASPGPGSLRLSGHVA